MALPTKNGGSMSGIKILFRRDKKMRGICIKEFIPFILIYPSKEVIFKVYPFVNTIVRFGGIRMIASRAQKIEKLFKARGPILPCGHRRGLCAQFPLPVIEYIHAPAERIL
jgi:hypothetical protein